MLETITFGILLILGIIGACMFSVLMGYCVEWLHKKYGWE